MMGSAPRFGGWHIRVSHKGFYEPLPTGA
jgi:hypothetical protein